MGPSQQLQATEVASATARNIELPMQGSREHAQPTRVLRVLRRIGDTEATQAHPALGALLLLQRIL